MKQRIHIFGASGSGTTTIGKLICDKLGYTHFDSDNYFWLPTHDPFTVQRENKECIDLMKNDLSNTPNWVLSGSLMGWGDVLIPFFDLIVFVYVPKDIRINRLKNREYERYGDEILKGRSQHKKYVDFIEWAESYDDGTKSGRSLFKHRSWINNLKRTVLEIENNDLEDSVKTVIESIKKIPCNRF